jgi:ABC-type sugar transport system ATPase subunit
MIEQLGADSLVHVGHGKTTVIARLPHGMHPDVGSTFALAAEPHRVFLFDATSGQRIR